MRSILRRICSAWAMNWARRIQRLSAEPLIVLFCTLLNIVSFGGFVLLQYSFVAIVDNRFRHHDFSQPASLNCQYRREVLSQMSVRYCALGTRMFFSMS